VTRNETPHTSGCVCARIRRRYDLRVARSLQLRTLSVDVAPLDADALPAEFRIFRAGVNPTSKGPAVFDDEAAVAVMAAWRTWGVDLMIDLNHDALDADDRSRPDASDARGWFGLEVRNGELWAVNVRWTPDGERRLREKTQRYISPAFLYDEETDRVCEILNVALVAMPATHNAQALIAAARLRAHTPRATLKLSAESRARIDALIARLNTHGS
jgi:phage I-like protein